MSIQKQVPANQQNGFIEKRVALEKGSKKCMIKNMLFSFKFAFVFQFDDLF